MFQRASGDYLADIYANRHIPTAQLKLGYTLLCSHYYKVANGSIKHG
jgi:hypothetical protein